MAQTNRTPPVALGGVQRELDGSQFLSTETGWAAQLIAARFGMDPARAKLVADFAFGGQRG